MAESESPAYVPSKIKKKTKENKNKKENQRGKKKEINKKEKVTVQKQGQSKRVSKLRIPDSYSSQDMHLDGLF